jgi:hypothetical protein
MNMTAERRAIDKLFKRVIVMILQIGSGRKFGTEIRNSV